MPQTKPIVSIENVVASASVDQRIDLNVITQTFPDVEYHPDQFPGLVFRLKSPKPATLVFSSGNWSARVQNRRSCQERPWQRKQRKHLQKSHYPEARGTRNLAS